MKTAPTKTLTSGNICAQHEPLCSRRGFLGLVTMTGISALLGMRPCAASADDVRWSVFGEDYPALQHCREAAAVDEEGNVLFSFNGDVSMAMASTTKIMTSVVALESGLPLDTTYTVTDVVDTVYGQLIGFRIGDQVTLNDLLHGLLVYSGNDAAVCIAECVGGSVSGFVEMMNAKASELGLTGTHYVNPHGLDEDGHYSTPLDLITLARHAVQIPLFSSIVGSSYTTVTAAGELKTLESTDELANSYPGMRGIKTGFTYNAGNCFVGRATRGNKTLFVCVLGCEDSAGRWADSRTLLDWAFSHYPELQGVATFDLVGYAPFTENAAWSTRIASTGGVTFRDEGTRQVESQTNGGGLSEPGSTVSTLQWQGDDGTTDAVRVEKGEAVLFESHAFGPLVSQLFY